MKVTVCEFPDEDDAKGPAWAALADYVARVNPHIVVLPEMPFCDWIFDREAVDRSAWRLAVEAHDVMMSRLGELACSWVASSRPVEEEGLRFNEAFVSARRLSARAAQVVPARRASRAGNKLVRARRPKFRARPGGLNRRRFSALQREEFPHHARDIGLGGAHLIVQPRGSGSAPRWRIASEISAITSGSYVASANRRTLRRERFSGRSSLLSPEAQLLCETTEEKPFATAEINAAMVEHAKSQFPRDLYRMYRD